MTTEWSTIEYIVSQLATAGDVYARKMFGEYALYCNERVVGLVTDNTLFVKITDKGKAFVGNQYQEGNAYRGAKASMVVSEDMMANRDWFAELIRLTAENLPLPKKKRKK